MGTRLPCRDGRRDPLLLAAGGSTRSTSLVPPPPAGSVVKRLAPTPLRRQSTASSNLAAIASPLLYPPHQRAPSFSRQEVSRKINCMDGAAEGLLVMPFDLLREITNDFSEERKLGSGSLEGLQGKINDGVHQDGVKIAVKMLYDMPGLDDELFQNEFKNLTRLRHQNIVRLVGYCHDIQVIQVMHEGKLVLAEKTHRALCLEYMSNGSLDKYLSDECDRYDWHTCYGIIKGICQGGSQKRPTIQDIVDILNETETKCTYAEADRNIFRQDAQDPFDKHVQHIYHGSKFNQDIISTPISTCFEENAGPTETRLDGDSNDNQDYSSGGDLLPSIEGFQVVGNPIPGSTLRACGFSINGTTLCNFQWVHYLEDGTRQSIEGATMYDYVVSADDVGAVLAVDCTPTDDNGRQGHLVRGFANSKQKITCGATMYNYVVTADDVGAALAVDYTPMDDNGHQGHLVRGFANSKQKITCDLKMQTDINICISRGRADFEVFFLKRYSPEEWEHAMLVLRPSGYQINFNHNDDDEVIIDEKYSPNVQLKIPTGQSTQFVLVSSGGVERTFNTQRITKPSNDENYVRLRDLIVLVMRTFQNKISSDPEDRKRSRAITAPIFASRRHRQPPTPSAPRLPLRHARGRWRLLPGWRGPRRPWLATAPAATARSGEISPPGGDPDPVAMADLVGATMVVGSGGRQQGESASARRDGDP
ncbi:hypothetical protein ZWY2020_000699 [Hordeum vulgare]|nr:hypothetical protein ZWY2020_000699 [Hordeum vulgare]